MKMLCTFARKSKKRMPRNEGATNKNGMRGRGEAIHKEGGRLLTKEGGGRIFAMRKG